MMELCFTGHGSLLPLFRGLKTAGECMGIEGFEGHFPPPCPKLDTLRVEYVDYDDGTVEAIVVMLYRRAFFELQPMEYMELYFGDEEERFEELEKERDIYREELQALCPQVEWASD
ncbi:hypothetical protein BV20DRAFT_580483 [Pilatotrama ljubarskyi]|nr:hypothetical protein BV20DRAFT_580483 [Pilatotrama ljubarskyi]